MDLNSINEMKLSFQITFYSFFFCAIILFGFYFFMKNEFKLIIIFEIIIVFVAMFYYYLFNEEIKGTIKWEDINILRYQDWMITTPLMLIAFCLFLSKTTRIPIKMETIIWVVILDFLMIGLGYLGEINVIERYIASCLAFIPWTIIFAIIYYTYLQLSKDINLIVLFHVFGLVWALYGIVYMFAPEIRNRFMNIMDLIAKGGVGIGMSLYLVYN